MRAGGKHNDLENVGYTARHHTFFEMLGNFSFGDYFKDRAIELAWNLITREFGLPRDRLLVTVYSEDDDAAELWAKIAGLPEERIIRIATSDNFWAMGDVGPCGPCSEIFCDHGPAIPGGPPGSPDADGDRFVEIWNLVFMQYEQLGPGERVPLPRASIDTGMGLERIAAVLQGKHDNYDIDLFRSLILASAEASGVAADGAHAVSHRVIADHLRASAFLIADGVLPSKDGRGYVLRRIMRRAMRHAHMLGCKEPLMWRLVPALVQQMGAAYPELVRAQPLITETLRLEETNFKQTLDRGLRLLEDETARLGPGEPFPGETAFRLYDTFGFPLDLTEDVLRAQGRKVAVEGFEAAMARQRAEARQELGRLGRGGDRGGVVRAARGDRRDRIPRLRDRNRRRGRAGDPARRRPRRPRPTAGDEVAIVVNQTPFYAEFGRPGRRHRRHLFGRRRRARGPRHGQEGGRSACPSRPADPRRAEGGRRRRAARRRRPPPPGARQSFGDASAAPGAAPAARRACDAKGLARRPRPDALRFQPSEAARRRRHSRDRGRGQRPHPRQRRGRHPSADPGPRRGRGRAGAVRREIRRRGARRRDGWRASTARTGRSRSSCAAARMCARTGDIGLFKIVAETAIASGVRRIEALTGAAAEAHLAEEEGLLRQAAAALRTSPAELPARIVSLVDERRRLERELAEARRALASAGPAAKAERQADRRDRL